jgi:glycine amidinotransferase
MMNLETGTGWTNDTTAQEVDLMPDTAPVGSYTEWDPLEEVLLGDPLGAIRPADMTVFDTVIPERFHGLIGELFADSGQRFPSEMVDLARSQIRALRERLEGEGITVTTATPIDFSTPISTPFWSVDHQFCSSNPRDSLMMIGDLLIEAPMLDRSRYFESFAYRPVIERLEARGARWIAAPRPMLTDASFRDDLERDADRHPTQWLATESEILFDAADFMKFGSDIVAMRSHVTNDRGIDWVARILGPQFTVHRIETINPYAMHLDDTIMPLREGLLLYSPDYVDPTRLPEIFRNWDVVEAPRVMLSQSNPLGDLSGWLNINLLSIDEERIIVERQQSATIDCLVNLGMKPILCDFEAYYPFVGSFHCASLDVRRRGALRCCR